MAMNLTLRKVFLYIFASIGLILCIFGLVSLINLGLKTYVFTKADNYCYHNAPSMVKDPNGQTISEEEQKRQDEINLKNCQEGQAASKQSQASNAIAMLIVGLPLYMYHWNVIRRDKEI